MAIISSTSTLFILLSTILGFCNTFSTQYYGNTRHEALPEHCYYEDLDLAVAVNSTLRPINIKGICVEINCQDDFVLAIKHCDRIMLPRGCHLTAYDYSKAYPSCCHNLICQ